MAVASLAAAGKPAAEMWSLAAFGMYPAWEVPNERYDVRGMRFNLIAGCHRNVTGVDFGTLVNICDGSCSGAEFAGICNVVAAVLTIRLVSLDYDPRTRRGKLAVRFNAGQAEESRKWIRRNIERLASDKNIALTTGQLPPAAKFYLGREEFKDGNILEIEFKTE